MYFGIWRSMVDFAISVQGAVEEGWILGRDYGEEKFGLNDTLTCAKEDRLVKITSLDDWEAIRSEEVNTMSDANILRRAISHKRTSVAEFVEKTGISPHVVKEVLSNRRILTHTEMTQIAKSYGRNPDNFLEWRGSDINNKDRLP